MTKRTGFLQLEEIPLNKVRLSTRDKILRVQPIYTNSGHMCFVAMNPKRPKWKSQISPTAEEMVSALSDGGFYAYCGTVEVHAQEGFVVHHIEIDKVPNLVGTTRKRWFEFEGPNRLRLRIDSPPAPIVESALVWERLQETGK